jgi:hypothetical protein
MAENVIFGSFHQLKNALGDQNGFAYWRCGCVGCGFLGGPIRQVEFFDHVCGVFLEVILHLIDQRT